MEVAEENCHPRARHDENHKNQEQKTKHVVNLMVPNTLHNEEEFDKDGTKW